MLRILTAHLSAQEVRNTEVSRKGDVGAQVAHSVDPGTLADTPLSNGTALRLKTVPRTPVSQSWKYKCN